MSMGSVVAWNMPNRLTYLYTVPMFHCNGWGYPWTTALLNAKVVCCRYIVAKDIYNLIDKHRRYTLWWCTYSFEFDCKR